MSAKNANIDKAENAIPETDSVRQDVKSWGTEMNIYLGIVPAKVSEKKASTDVETLMCWELEDYIGWCVEASRVTRF